MAYAKDKHKHTGKAAYLGAVYAFLYLPLLMVVAYSFNSAERSLLWHHFSLQWYNALIHDDALLGITLHSLIIGILSATLATLIAALISIALVRRRTPLLRLTSSTFMLLILIPDLILAIAWLILFNTFDIPLGFWSLLIAHMTFCTPFTFVLVHTRMRLLDNHLIEAAKDLGASESQLYTRILLPLLLPAMLAGWLLSFTLSLDDVMISYFVSGPDYQILPLHIYSLVKTGISPEINALCSLLLVFTLFVVFTSQTLLRRKDAR